MEFPMGLFSKPIKSLNDLFLHMLQDIYYAEQQITKNLPTMIEKASDPQLRAAFQTHLNETQNQIQRLEQVFGMIGEQVKGVTCDAMDGILSEAKEIISDCDDQLVLDCAMLTAAQSVEHYEICRYGTLIALAKQLGHSNVCPLLQQTLDEEKATDRKLTTLADGQINRKAA
jgi:ferritin-like metal-binding protein YciE